MLLEICAVVVTVALVAIAVASIRAMKTFQRTADEATRTLAAGRKAAAEVRQIADSIRSIADEVQQSLDGLRKVKQQFADVRERATHLTRGSFAEMRETVREAAGSVRDGRQNATRVLHAARELTEQVFQKVASSTSTPFRSYGG